MEKLRTSDQFPYSLGKFKSLIPLGAPDAEAYTTQKGVSFINVVPNDLPEVELSTSLTDLHNESWRIIHAPLINLSVYGNFDPKNCYPRTFPGPIISGPKHTEQYVGSTSWELFNYVLTIPQRIIDIDKLSFNNASGYSYSGERPVIELSDIPSPEKWFWDVAIPKLKQLQLGGTLLNEDPRVLFNKKGKIMKRLYSETKAFWQKFTPGDPPSQRAETKKMLGLIQIIQTPFVKNDISENAIQTANAILSHYFNLGIDKNILPLLFQIESAVMYAQTMSERDIVARGFYGHSWIEAAKTNVEDLRSTELVDEKRAIIEIVNLINRGWAPIIVDERLNNTDGSHRGIAVRVWDLLKSMYEAGIKDPTDVINPKVQLAIKSFINSRKDMNGLTLRETLRVAQELLTNPIYQEHRKTIFDALPTHPYIKYVPTILLREQEACCVVKVPFDQEGKIIGVDPFITFTLTNNKNDMALGSRGPYHRTDKSPAPWFNVFSLQKV